VLLTSRGVPNIYYGTEQYMTGIGDPYNRKMMSSFNRSTKAYNIIKILSCLRKSNMALAYGYTRERWVNSDVFIYERKFGESVVLVAVNRSSDTYDITGLFTALPPGKYTDILGRILDGEDIYVNTDGSVDELKLNPEEVGIWHYKADSKYPIIGHIGPMIGKQSHTITIDGEGFGSNIGSVYFGSEIADINFWSDKQIRVIVPDVPSGDYSVMVSTTEGLKSDIYDNFQVLSSNQVCVRFVVKGAETFLGENVYIVGNVAELGNWRVDKSFGPMFNQIIYPYPNWYYDVSVPANRLIEFKFIKKDDKENVIWESGPNHTYLTPLNSTGKVVVNWQQ